MPASSRWPVPSAAPADDVLEGRRRHAAGQARQGLGSAGACRTGSAAASAGPSRTGCTGRWRSAGRCRSRWRASSRCPGTAGRAPAGDARSRWPVPRAGRTASRGTSATRGRRPTRRPRPARRRDRRRSVRDRTATRNRSGSVACVCRYRPVIPVGSNGHSGLVEPHEVVVERGVPDARAVLELLGADRPDLRDLHAARTGRPRLDVGVGSASSSVTRRSRRRRWSARARPA